MTIEEKAKAYDEALKWMRELYPRLHGATKEDAEHYFPELCESEDEKIRKELIFFLKEEIPQCSIKEHADKLKEFVSYLEKQKEPHIPWYDYQKSKAAGYTIVPNEEYEQLIRQKEQKPVHTAKEAWKEMRLEVYAQASGNRHEPNYSDDSTKMFSLCDIDEIFEKIGNSTVGPQPAEKQDYSGLNDLERSIHRGFLRAGVENVPVIIIKETAKECLEQMKPAEWSEDWREEDIQTRFAFYTYKDDPSVLYLSNVFVEETSRNHGFGTRILKAAEKAAEAIGAITICLKVKQDSPANAWYRKHGYGYVAYEDGYDWLEKNLEYLKPAKSAEWSEEDEQEYAENDAVRRQSTIQVLEYAKSLDAYNQYGKKDISKDIAWLKSRRPPQYCENCRLKKSVQGWKPSEEQIEALRRAVNKLANTDIADSVRLSIMYDNLKKL